MWMDGLGGVKVILDVNLLGGTDDVDPSKCWRLITR